MLRVEAEAAWVQVVVSRTCENHSRSCYGPGYMEERDTWVKSAHLPHVRTPRGRGHMTSSSDNVQSTLGTRGASGETGVLAHATTEGLRGIVKFIPMVTPCPYYYYEVGSKCPDPQLRC